MIVDALSVGGAHIIFRAGTDEGGKRLVSVQVNLHLPFPPPGVFVHFMGEDADIGAEKPALPFDSRQHFEVLAESGFQMAPRFSRPPAPFCPLVFSKLSQRVFLAAGI